MLLFPTGILFSSHRCDRGLFPGTDAVNDTVAAHLEMRYDEVFYVLSVRTDEGTTGYFMSRKDFNRVAPGSRIRYSV